MSTDGTQRPNDMRKEDVKMQGDPTQVECHDITLKPSGDVQISAPDECAIATFYDQGTFANITRLIGFSLDEEIGHIVELIRDEDPRVKMCGLRLWASVLSRMLGVSGIVHTQKLRSRSTTSDGHVVEAEQSVSRLVSSIRKDSPHGAKKITQDPGPDDDSPDGDDGDDSPGDYPE